ncbi:hypothetical protein GCM10011487_52520 [Steroidobacter agaridevorans]|uniref:Uncharacterized protein n=1 Tax=Steroidobacter agaridevorans TaxID=2695856 RepID=A0A829YKC0_9GAMM|nr:hypothetical protein GCM10011487_52520 [Steroidobacter agaridevorans]
MRARGFWLILETVVAYAVPAYHWIWGVIMLPLWLWGAASAESTSIWFIASLIGGVLGAIGVVGLLTVAIAREPVSTLNFSLLALLSCAGLLAVWAMMTGLFAGFSLDPFSLVAIVAPTACTVHLLVLCARLIGAEVQPFPH